MSNLWKPLFQTKHNLWQWITGVLVQERSTMTPLWKVWRLIGRSVSFRALQACRISSTATNRTESAIFFWRASVSATPLLRSPILYLAIHISGGIWGGHLTVSDGFQKSGNISIIKTVFANEKPVLWTDGQTPHWLEMLRPDPDPYSEYG